jgi:sporulation protein YlmC with PRC-barrel domain
MTKNLSHGALAALTIVGALCSATPAVAQVAGGTTTVGISITESTQLAMGWSVKKTLMGKTVYNDAGQKVGKVEDLIISPDKKVSYVIVGAGGFIGMGRHDVAIPVTQIEDKAGKLVMAGATKDTIKGMQTFTYATDTARRDQFVAAADKDLALGRAKLADLKKKASVAASDAKAKIDLQVAALQIDVESTEAKLSDMKKATAVGWREFEASVSAATARLRKSIDAATG